MWVEGGSRQREGEEEGQEAAVPAHRHASETKRERRHRSSVARQ